MRREAVGGYDDSPPIKHASSEHTRLIGVMLPDGRVRRVRWLPRFNMKREVWPGGPQVEQVLEAQLSPAARAPATAEPANDAAVVNLLLLLR
jgi:hypothetical protein